MSLQESRAGVINSEDLCLEAERDLTPVIEYNLEQEEID